MHHGVYNYFMTQLVSLKPEVKQIKAVGTDGELALCNAVKDYFPDAVHLRCLKHVKDSIENKLQDLQFNKMGIKEIICDIFRVIGDRVKEIGFADTADTDDFFKSLCLWRKNGITLKVVIILSC